MNRYKPKALENRYSGRHRREHTLRLCRSLLGEIEDERQTSQPSRHCRACQVAGRALIRRLHRLVPALKILSKSPVALNADLFRTSGALREGIDRRSRSHSSPGETSGSLWSRLIPLFARQQTYVGSFHVKAFALQQRHELLAILQFQAEKGDMIGHGRGILNTEEIESLEQRLALG